MKESIYKLMNYDLREIFVCSSPLDEERLKAEHASKPPAPIAHWRPGGQKIQYTKAGAALGEHDVDAFLENYALTTGLPGWKML